jgi:histidine ammonia-lyase
VPGQLRNPQPGPLPGTGQLRNPRPLAAGLAGLSLRVIHTLELNGASLTCGQVARAAHGEIRVSAGEAGRRAAARSSQAARELAASRPVYGRTTGFGANQAVAVPAPGQAGHGLGLLRSHAVSTGPLLPPEVARAMLVIRLNQLAAGGSGVDPGLLDVLADAVNRGFTPPVPCYGAVGTGDLAALAATGLCLLGERDWRAGTGPPPRFLLAGAEALGFISSNAATLADATLACCHLDLLLRAAVAVAALSLLAVRGSLEPYAEAVARARPHPGQQRVAATVRALLPGGAGPPARVQDPFGFRAFPQVHGPALDALGYAGQVLAIEINAAAENPLIDPAGRTAWHNGNFHAAYPCLALDAVRAALFQTAALSAARLAALADPACTGLAPFLAAGPGSSGIMVLEYAAQSALAGLRQLATPAALGGAVLSRGAEEHASFAPQSARATAEAVTAYRMVLACELVAAVRAVRMRGATVQGALAGALAAAGAALGRDLADRPLDTDLAAADGLLADYATLALPPLLP